MTNTNFIDWLKLEIYKRGWSPAELARQSKISPTQISRLLKGERGIGETGIVSIAHALKLPADLVFEKAGILPPKPELSPIKRALLYAADGLPDSDLQLALSLLEQRQEYYKKNPGAKPAK